jgi:arginine/lysine/ornithine decarboxylase
MIDLSSLGISGYQAADWLHEHERIDMHLSDYARIMATISIADDEETAHRLREALKRLIDAADDLPRPKPVKIPDPPGLELETVNRPP